MTESSLITVRPQTRKKGFRPENLRIVPMIPDYQAVYGRITQALARTPDLSPRAQHIIDKVVASYETVAAGLPLTADGMILSGHELAELGHISDESVLRYVVYRYRYNKYPELRIADDYPPCLQIEPTSICNFRCIMCYQIDKTFSSRSSGHMGYMKLDFFKRVIDEVEGQLEAVTFASRGEPLLHPELTQMLEYCRGKFLGLKLNTNASLLNEKAIHDLLSSDLQTLVFSIDAADRDLYEKIRVNGKFDKLMRNLELFAKIRSTQYSASPIVVRISGVKINDDQDIEKMHSVWHRYADIIAFTNYNPWQDSYENDPNQVETPCSELWRRMFVWWDGKVNPCDFDYKSVLSRWNLTTTSIREIWNSDWYRELRGHHSDGRRNEIEPCRRCIVT